MNVADCPHKRLYHESKRVTFCKDCKVPMNRHRGDWMPDPTAVAHARKEQNERSDP